MNTLLTDLVGCSMDEIHIDAARPSQLVVLTAEGAILFTVDIATLYDKHGNRFSLEGIPTQYKPTEY